jgi:hypothetical protein
MKTSKKKEKLSFVCKNQWFKVLPRRLDSGGFALETVSSWITAFEHLFCY